MEDTSARILSERVRLRASMLSGSRGGSRRCGGDDDTEEGDDGRHIRHGQDEGGGGGDDEESDDDRFCCSVAQTFRWYSSMIGRKWRSPKSGQ